MPGDIPQRSYTEICLDIPQSPYDFQGEVAPRRMAQCLLFLFSRKKVIVLTLLGFLLGIILGGITVQQLQITSASPGLFLGIILGLSIGSCLLGVTISYYLEKKCCPDREMQHFYQREAARAQVRVDALETKKKKIIEACEEEKNRIEERRERLVIAQKEGEKIYGNIQIVTAHNKMLQQEKKDAQDELTRWTEIQRDAVRKQFKRPREMGVKDLFSQEKELGRLEKQVNQYQEIWRRLKKRRICTLSQTKIGDPTTLANGRTYDKKAIEAWFEQHKSKDNTGAWRASFWDPIKKESITISPPFVTNWTVKKFFEAMDKDKNIPKAEQLTKKQTHSFSPHT